MIPPIEPLAGVFIPLVVLVLRIAACGAVVGSLGVTVLVALAGRPRTRATNVVRAVPRRMPRAA